MIYAMADIHGDYESYMEMLRKIKFSDRDTLYVLGDVVDRGEGGIKILQDMMMRPNVYPIMGNHEYMMNECMDFLMMEVTEENVKHVENDMDSELMQGLMEWMSVGGDATMKELRALDEEDKEMVLEYLSEFAPYEIVEVGGKVFILVHAGLDNFDPDRELDDYNLSELLFSTPDYEKVYFEKAYLVTGHLPTFAIWARMKGESPEEQPQSERKYDIFEKNNHIAIDCGCGYDGKLGCICLDTLEKFYV